MILYRNVKNNVLSKYVLYADFVIICAVFINNVFFIYDVYTKCNE